jgi:hypothetical protein
MPQTRQVLTSLVDRASSCVGDRNLSPRESENGDPERRRRRMSEVRHVRKERDLRSRGMLRGVTLPPIVGLHDRAVEQADPNLDCLP